MSIVIKEENFYDFWPEGVALRQSNHTESPIAIPDLTLNLNLEKYKRAVTANAFVAITVRDDGKLVGYHMTFLDINLHFSVLSGVSDAYYLDPNYRGQGLGRTLIRQTEKAWKNREAKLGFIGTRNANSFGRLFEQEGWTPNEQTFVKKLGDWQ